MAISEQDFLRVESQLFRLASSHHKRRVVVEVFSALGALWALSSESERAAGIQYGVEDILWRMTQAGHPREEKSVRMGLNTLIKDCLVLRKKLPPYEGCSRYKIQASHLETYFNPVHKPELSGMISHMGDLLSGTLSKMSGTLSKMSEEELKKDIYSVQTEEKDHVYGAKPLQPTHSNLGGKVVGVPTGHTLSLGGEIFGGGDRIASLEAKLNEAVNVINGTNLLVFKIASLMETQGTAALKPQEIPQAHPDLRPALDTTPDKNWEQLAQAHAEGKSPVEAPKPKEILPLSPRALAKKNQALQMFPRVPAEWKDCADQFLVAVCNYLANNELHINRNSVRGSADPVMRSQHPHRPALWLNWCLHDGPYVRSMMCPSDVAEVEILRSLLIPLMPNTPDLDRFGDHDKDLLALWRYLHQVNADLAGGDYNKALTRYLAFLKTFAEKVPGAEMKYFMMRSNCKLNLLQSQMKAILSGSGVSDEYLKRIKKDYKKLTEAKKAKSKPLTPEQKEVKAKEKAEAAAAKAERKKETVEAYKAFRAKTFVDKQQQAQHGLILAKFKVFYSAMFKDKVVPLLLPLQEEGQSTEDYNTIIQSEIWDLFNYWYKVAQIVEHNVEATARYAQVFWDKARELGAHKYSLGKFESYPGRPLPTPGFLFSRFPHPRHPQNQLNSIDVLTLEARAVIHRTDCSVV